MADPAKADAPPQDNKKKLFIIIGIAVALAVLGGAAMFVLGGSKEKKPAAESAKVEGGAKAEGGKEGGHEGGKEGGAASSIYPLEPFVVNIYDGQELRYLKVKVEFELNNPNSKAEMDSKVAPIRDAVLVVLTTKTLQEVQDLQGKNALKAQILGAVSKIVSPNAVSKVYFTDFVVQ